MFGIFKRKPKEPVLTESDLEWKAAFENILHELVPGEKFELIAVKGVDGKTRFELVTESRRALVAWAEVQEVLVPTPPSAGLSL